MAARVLVKLGVDLNRVRQQVIQLLHGHRGKEPEPIPALRERGLARDTRQDHVINPSLPATA